MRLTALGLLLAGAALCAPSLFAQPSTESGIDRLVASLGHAIEAGDAGALGALASPDSRPFQEFVASITAAGASRATVVERDRTLLPGVGQRLFVEILTERQRAGRLSTWRIDVAPLRPGDPDAAWRIVDIEQFTVVEGLYRLALDTAREYDVDNLVVQAPDLTLTVPSGHAFLARTAAGPTAVVLIGRGRAVFAPKAPAERGQVRIFCGREPLSEEFDGVFVRLNPAEFEARFAAGSLRPRSGVDGQHARKAQQLFEAQAPLSFQVNLGDLSAERWSVAPTGGDFVADIATRKYGVLTYSRAGAEPEDISFFDRRRRKQIAVYASEAQLASRGALFAEDDRAEYDVLHYDLDTAFTPERLWVDGAARLRVRTRAAPVTTMVLRLADSLAVRSLTSPQFRNLLSLRVVGQNSLLVGFPGVVAGGTEFELDVRYGGRLAPQQLDREAMQSGDERLVREALAVPVEPQWVYSNRSLWYPQGIVTDYATARMTIVVPGDLSIVASGAPAGPPTLLPATDSRHARKQFVFETGQPVRYLGWIASRFEPGRTATLDAASTTRPVNPLVRANPREAARAGDFAEKTSDILAFYTSLIGQAPYSSFTVALTESELPGGHSPAYFAIVNQPLPTSRYNWANDPVVFRNCASFFLAHEVAHQWWGQAVGWKNYHEQWISEGFAQYFAALYAERERGPEQLAAVLRQMRRTAIEASGEGPVYLGYRLGHIKSDSRVFRALVYNKAALVLHMLRRLVGDRAFFSGLRAFYAEWRYRKAGTDDFRKAMETASGRALQQFFTQWIHQDGIPVVRFSSRVEGQTVRVRFEQQGDIYELPLTLTLTYADGTSEDMVVQVGRKVVEQTLPLKGTLRSLDVNRDGSVLAEIVK